MQEQNLEPTANPLTEPTANSTANSPANQSEPTATALPTVPDLAAMRQRLACPHCGRELSGVIQYYAHVSHYHAGGSRPLKVGKKATRAPLASELLAAMEVAGCGKERAARVMNVSSAYFEKWARLLIPDEWAEYRARPITALISGRSSPLTTRPSYLLAIEVLAGRTPAPREWSKTPHRRCAQLQRYGLLPGSCQLCGFAEVRVDTHRSPVLMDFIDGDSSNWVESNLRVLCYNCYFLNVHDLWGRNKTLALNGAF